MKARVLAIALILAAMTSGPAPAAPPSDEAQALTARALARVLVSAAANAEIGAPDDSGEAAQLVSYDATRALARMPYRVVAPILSRVAAEGELSARLWAVKALLSSCGFDCPEPVRLRQISLIERALFDPPPGAEFAVEMLATNCRDASLRGRRRQ